MLHLFPLVHQVISRRHSRGCFSVLILAHSSQLAHHLSQDNTKHNWTALLCRAQPFFLTSRVFINLLLHYRRVSYPDRSLWFQWGYNCADVHGFLASVCCPCIWITGAGYLVVLVWKGKFKSLHHTVSQARHNCTSYFHFSSELEPHFRQLVMEGARLSRARWEAAVAAHPRRLSAASGTLGTVTVIYLLLAPDGSRGGLNRALTRPVPSCVFWSTQY